MTEKALVDHLNRISEVLAGAITTQWVILDLLHRKGLVPKEAIIADLEYARDALKQPPSIEPDRLVALEHLIQCFSRGSQPKETARWTPVVIPGGAGQEDA